MDNAPAPVDPYAALALAAAHLRSVRHRAVSGAPRSPDVEAISWEEEIDDALGALSRALGDALAHAAPLVDGLAAGKLRAWLRVESMRVLVCFTGGSEPYYLEAHRHTRAEVVEHWEHYCAAQPLALQEAEVRA
jgi:hypothetical protein